MTDLIPSLDATRSCPECGAQNDVTAVQCDRCGADLPPAPGREAERGDLEIVEVARAMVSEGYDQEFEVVGEDLLRCPACGSTFAPKEVAVEQAVPAQDTPSGAADAEVIAGPCPLCGVSGHVALGADIDDGQV